MTPQGQDGHRHHRNQRALALAPGLVFACLAGCGGASADRSDSQSDRAVATDVGAAVGAPAVKSIGSAGGTAISPDGMLEVIIPAGALSADTPISIQPITNHCHGGIANKAYRLEPDGKTFQSKVTLRYHYQPAACKGTDPRALGIAIQQADRTWAALPRTVVDTGKNVVAAQVDHFTDYALFTDWQIDPATAEVQVGEQATLTIKHLERRADPGDAEALAPLVGTFAPATANLDAIKNWTVNGSPLGNTIDGHVVASNPTATYTAPDTVPQDNPVAVAVEIEIPGKPKLQLVSNIKVTKTGTYKLEIKDTGLLSGGVCYCQITSYYDVSTIEFSFDQSGQVVPGHLDNRAPTISFVATPGALCTSVTNPLGTVHIMGIFGQLKSNSTIALEVYLVSESPGVTSTMMGVPCSVQPASNSSTLILNKFNTTDPVQTLTTPLGTQISLTKLSS